jgi:hypothetical protein
MLEEEPQENAVFSFAAHVDDVPIYMGNLAVGVNRASGQIISYMGLEDHPSVFISVPRQPAVSFQKALERYAAELEIRLEWFYQYKGERDAENQAETADNSPAPHKQPSGVRGETSEIHHRDKGIRYTLIYRPHFPNGEIRFIDAMTGEPIRERNKR